MNLLKPLILVSLATFLSKILGFIRDVIIARIFGAGMMTDTFFISFKIINLLRRIFAEGVFFQIFVPVLVDYKNKSNNYTTKYFISCVLGILIFILSITVILGIIFTPYILKLVVPGFLNTSFKFNLTIKVLRVMFPFIMIISLSSMFIAILNVWNIFFTPALSSIFLNGNMIIFAIFSYLFKPPILSLAWSIILGGIIQLIFLLKYLNDMNMVVSPKIDFNNSGILIMLKKMWPALISVLIHQFSVIGNTIFTSFLSSGSISWMYYADRIIEFPLGILGVALNTILFPSLSKSVTEKNNKEYSKSLDWGLRLCFILSIPISVMLSILSKPIVFSMFQYGKFSFYDAVMTQYALISYSIGLFGIILVRILTPSFYSYKDTKTPLKISLITFLVTQLMNFILIFFLKHIGLSLSIGLTAWFNSFLLYIYLIKKKLFIPQSNWKKFIIKVIFSVLIMSIYSVFILIFMPSWQIGNVISRLIRLFIIIFLISLVYIISLIYNGFKLNNFYHSI